MDLKERIKKLLLQRFKISFDTSEELFSEGLLSETGCRKFLIKYEYKALVGKDGRTSAIVELADKYFVSTSTIWGDIYR